MLFFELFSLNLSRLFHCSVIKVLCPAVLRDNFYILSQLSAFVNRFFHKKNNFFRKPSGEGGIRTLAPVTRPIPLAGAPLRPLEYFSWLRIHNLLCNLKRISFRNAWLIIHNILYIVNTFFIFILIFFCFVFTLILETPEFYDKLKLIVTVHR